MGVKPTSMIDVSDGVASELMHLCKSGELGCVIYDEKLPIDQETYNTARDFDLDASVPALNGGEDYELLFSIKQEDFEKIKDSEHMTVIGHYTDKNSGCHIVDRGGQLIPLSAQGWNHFN